LAEIMQEPGVVVAIGYIGHRYQKLEVIRFMAVAGYAITVISHIIFVQHMFHSNKFFRFSPSSFKGGDVLGYFRLLINNYLD